MVIVSWSSDVNIFWCYFFCLLRHQKFELNISFRWSWSNYKQRKTLTLIRQNKTATTAQNSSCFMMPIPWICASEKFGILYRDELVFPQLVATII
jgi:hypothetical protein